MRFALMTEPQMGLTYAQQLEIVRRAEDAGFEAVYLSGAGLTNQFYGIPDLGFISLNDVASHTAAIRDVIRLPLIVDIDVGFGNAVNAHHTIKVLERSGANAVQIEDQAMPKRCGHFAGKSIISKEEMCGKIKAAVDARAHDDFLIIARTDARSINGLQDALDRAQAYAQAGADMTFIEAPESVEEMKTIASQTYCPQLINMVIGGKTPITDADELSRWGYGLVLYANAALQGAVAAVWRSTASILVKGSRFMKMERVIDALQATATSKEDIPCC